MGRMKCQACKGASLREHERRLANPGPWNDWMDKSGRSIKVNRYEVVSAGAYEAGAKAANLQLCGSCAFSLIVSMHDDHADQMALVLTGFRHDRDRLDWFSSWCSGDEYPPWPDDMTNKEIVEHILGCKLRIDFDFEDDQ